MPDILASFEGKFIYKLLPAFKTQWYINPQIWLLNVPLKINKNLEIWGLQFHEVTISCHLTVLVLFIWVMSQYLISVIFYVLASPSSSLSVACMGIWV